MRRQAAIVLAVCFCLTAFAYRRAPTSFLRAESGLYLRVSHSDQAAQRDFTRKFFTESYGGHYTPLAFLAEFETAKWVGTHRAFWRWRQIVVLALVAAASFAALTAVAGIFQVGRSERIAIAAMLSAIAVFQPAMVDFVSWPFMVMQLLWLGLLMLALYSVAKLNLSPDARPWPWLAAAAAYASMHVSGLGFATVVAVSAVLSVVLLTSFNGRSPLLPATRNRIALALISLACFAAVHGWAMIHLLRDHHSSADIPTVHSLTAVKLLLGFVFNFACAGLRSFCLTSPSTPNMLAIAFCWPLGVLLVAAIILGLCKAISSTTCNPLSPRLGQSLILIFSAAGFFALVSLVAAREMAEAPRSSGGFVPYFGAFIGTPRYLIPLHYLLLGPAAIVLTYVARSRRTTTIACGAVVIAAVIAQLEFQRTPMRSVMPATRISHYSAWRLVLATARQCRAAGLPMPNLPLSALTMEFADENIESFLPLLRHDLALQGDDKLGLIAWPLAARESASRYAAIRPLKELERQLNLWPSPTSEK